MQVLVNTELGLESIEMLLFGLMIPYYVDSFHAISLSVWDPHCMYFSSLDTPNVGDIVYDDAEECLIRECTAPSFNYGLISSLRYISPVSAF